MLQYLVILAIMFVIWLIRFEISTRSAQRAAWRITPDQTREAEECIRMTKEAFEEKHLRHLMLSDFQFHAQVTDEERRDMNRLQAKLDQQLKELMDYLHLLPVLHVRVFTDDPKGKEAAGTFDWANKAVNIYYRSYYDAGILNEILCHECAHYFRYVHQITIPDHLTDEKCTDVTACLMGGRLYEVNANNIGYLRPGQMKLVGDFLDQYRKENSRQAAQPAGSSARAKPAAQKQQTAAAPSGTAGPQANSLSAERESLRRNIEAARAMIRHAEDIMAVKKVPTRTDLTEQDYAWLKRCVDKLGKGQYAALLSQCENSLQGNMGKIRNANSQVTSVCADISRLMWMFR